MTNTFGSPEERPKPSLLNLIRRKIITGLTVIVPLWFTGWVLWTLFLWADGFSAPLIKQFAQTLGYPGFHIPGLGLLLTVFILFLVGLIATNVVGRRLVRYGKEVLGRLPIVRTIYAPVQQLTETLASPEKKGFKKVVLVEYPRTGLWTLGFLAGDVPQEGRPEPTHSIFVPTAPNPTTGFMLIVPVEQLRDTTLSIEAALKMIVSAGVVVPPTLTLPADEEEEEVSPGIHRLD